MLFTVIANRISDSEIAVISLETGKWRTVLRGGFHARYAPTGHLVYGFDNSLRAVGFDLDRLATAGSPQELVSDVLTKINFATADFDVSKSGSLVYVPSAADTRVLRTLVWVDGEGKRIVVGAGPRAIRDAAVVPGRYTRRRWQ